MTLFDDPPVGKAISRIWFKPTGIRNTSIVPSFRFTNIYTYRVRVSGSTSPVRGLQVRPLRCGVSRFDLSGAGSPGSTSPVRVSGPGSGSGSWGPGFGGSGFGSWGPGLGSRVLSLLVVAFSALQGRLQGKVVLPRGAVQFEREHAMVWRIALCTRLHCFAHRVYGDAVFTPRR